MYILPQMCICRSMICLLLLKQLLYCCFVQLKHTKTNWILRVKMTSQCTYKDLKHKDNHKTASTLLSYGPLLFTN